MNRKSILSLSYSIKTNSKFAVIQYLKLYF